MKRILPILAVLLLTAALTAFGQPVPNRPSNGATDQPIDVTIGWRPLTSVRGYEAHISTTPSFGEYEQVFTVESSAEVLNLLYGTTYYWRVRGVNEELDSATEWSSVQSFTVADGAGIPQPLLPEEGATEQPRSVELQWSGVSEATGYEVEYAYDPGFLGGVVVSASATTYALSGLDYAQQIFWRVRRISAAAGPGEWSRFSSFTTEYKVPDPLDAPRLLSPQNGAVDQPTELRLLWSEVAGREILYDVEVGLDEGFTELAWSSLDLDSTSLDLTALENSRLYFWRARARNSETESEWSSVFRFTTIADPPSTPLAPQLLTPLNGSAQVPVLVLLTWDSIDDAAWYEVEFGRDPSFTERDTLIRTPNASAELGELAPETTYHWRARAGNENGPSGWSRPFRFTTAPDQPQLPETPRLLAPANAATGVEMPATLLWRPSANAVSYAIQLSTTGQFNGEQETFDALDTTSLLDELPEGTEFFWRVQGRNPFGASEWSESWSFTTAGGVTSVVQEKALNGLRIYPLPASEHLTVELPEGKGDVRLSLFDVRGLLRTEKEFAAGENASGRFVLPLDGIPAGIWYCRINVGETVITRPVIVVR